MSNTPYVGRNVYGFNTGQEFEGFSKVVIVVTDKLEYSSGKDTGRTLTMSCPWGTQAMADDILADIKGYKYHPYSATGAFLDPSSEIGDGVTVNGIYSGIYTMDVDFRGGCRADISAPSEEEIDHEYPYIPQQERTIRRKFAQVESEFEVQAGQIAARVTKTGGDSASFGWELDEDSWTLKSQHRTVLDATENGVVITCKLFAEEGGKIGGFDIMSNYLSYNGQTWKGENALGAYLGINGFQMGNKFRVDMSGNLYAASGTFEGNVYAKNIQYGTPETGTLSGVAISKNTIAAGLDGPFTKGVNDSLSYADYSHDIFSGKETAEYMYAKEIDASKSLSGKEIYCGGTKLRKKSISFKDGDGESVYIYYWAWESSI